jgi:hypothetical protein
MRGGDGGTDGEGCEAAMGGLHGLVVAYRKGLNGCGLRGLDESVWQLAAVRLCNTLPEKMLNVAAEEKEDHATR